MLYFCFIQQGKLACIAFLRHYIATKKPPKKSCSTNPNAGEEGDSITKSSSDAGPGAGDAGVTNETFVMDEEIPQDVNNRPSSDSEDKSDMDKEGNLSSNKDDN